MRAPENIYQSINWLVHFFFIELQCLTSFYFSLKQANAANPANGTCNTPKQHKGNCIILHKCSSLLTLLLKEPLTDDDQQYLRDSQCGSVNNNEPLVCCPDEAGAGQSDPDNNLLVERHADRTTERTAVEIESFANRKGMDRNTTCLTPDQLDGTCIDLRLCDSLLAVLQKQPLTQDDKDFLKSRQCGLSSDSAWVCCPKTNSSDKPVDDTDEDSSDDSGKLLESACGEQPVLFNVHGGQKTQIDEFPW